MKHIVAESAGCTREPAWKPSGDVVVEKLGLSRQLTADRDGKAYDLALSGQFTPSTVSQ